MKNENIFYLFYSLTISLYIYQKRNKRNKENRIVEINQNKEITTFSVYDLIKEIKENPSKENITKLSNYGAFTKLQNEIYKYNGLIVIIELTQSLDNEIRKSSLLLLGNCCTNGIIYLIIEKLVREFIEFNGINTIESNLNSNDNDEIIYTLRIYQNISLLPDIADSIYILL